MNKISVFILIFSFFFTSTGINKNLKSQMKVRQLLFILLIKRNIFTSLLIELRGVFGEDHEGEHSGGFQVFHVEWERVEIPYAIGLWIILTAIIKVGKSRGLEDY